MRGIFNAVNFEQQAANGVIKEWVRKVNPVDPTRTRIDENVPLGSVTNDVRYLDKNNNEICRAHRYIRPDGTIGGKGRTDPKTIFVGETKYHQNSPGKEPDVVLTEEEIQRIATEIIELISR
jgi:hypothetical protein